MEFGSKEHLAWLRKHTPPKGFYVILIDKDGLWEGVRWYAYRAQ